MVEKPKYLTIIACWLMSYWTWHVSDLWVLQESTIHRVWDVAMCIDDEYKFSICSENVINLTQKPPWMVHINNTPPQWLWWICRVATHNKENIHVLGSRSASRILRPKQSNYESKSRGITYCSRFKCLFSNPDWLERILLTAIILSSGVRNHAVWGLSGKKNHEMQGVLASVKSIVGRGHTRIKFR